MASRTYTLPTAYPYRRVVLALLLAVTCALALDSAPGWIAACALYEPWSAEWLVLGCWYGAPGAPRV